MRSSLAVITLSVYIFILASCCTQSGVNINDPYESINRKTYQFNRAFDATFLKPLARLYKKIIPDTVRISINNIYNNINMIPTAINDGLQGDYKNVIKDTWRFVINSTLGIGGVFDLAATRFELPQHSNDLGLTFAKWGDKKSPYVVLPFLGPSTIRDGMGIAFEYPLITPYTYITNIALLYDILGLRYVDLRAQLLDKESLMQDALDPYTFIRDAYLQYRNFRINNEVADLSGNDYVD
ncbi:MAG: ABC transporter [Legionellales bacterium RIFCSPHIGHO2_12_FULL_35_11]|nr:MAG: ABC transporter [Legionellales bacterium RIFCSPHIGHO2_12_FULL_35_11]